MISLSIRVVLNLGSPFIVHSTHVPPRSLDDLNNICCFVASDSRVIDAGFDSYGGECFPKILCLLLLQPQSRLNGSA